MKKLLNSSIFDHLIKGLLLAGVLASVYFVVDLRDFVKFTQPQRDELQDKQLQILNQKLEMIDSLQCEKNRAVNMRIDNMKEDLNEIKQDIKRLLFKDYTTYNK